MIYSEQSIFQINCSSSMMNWCYWNHYLKWVSSQWPKWQNFLSKEEISEAINYW